MTINLLKEDTNGLTRELEGVANFIKKPGKRGKQKV